MTVRKDAADLRRRKEPEDYEREAIAWLLSKGGRVRGSMRATGARIARASRYTAAIGRLRRAGVFEVSEEPGNRYVRLVCSDATVVRPGKGDLRDDEDAA